MNRRLTNHEIDAFGKDDPHRFRASLPAGEVVFAEVRNGFHNNKLVMAIDSEQGAPSIEREFLFLAEDGVVPEGAQRIAAYRPHAVEGAWVIYELTDVDAA